MTSQPFAMTVRTSADVLALWTKLVPPAERSRRTLWLAFLDREDRTLPTAIPIDELPAGPDTLLCGNLRKIVEELAATGPVRSALLLLARPGTRAATPNDHRWAAMVRETIGELSRWPLHVATPAGIYSLEDDGLSAAS